VCQRLTTDAIAVGRRLVWFQCAECRTVWRASKDTPSPSAPALTRKTGADDRDD
jgi:hypothetical protein